MTTIVRSNHEAVVIAIRGYALVTEASKKRKYSGKFDDMARFLGWNDCLDALAAIEPRFKQARSIQEKIQYEAEGLSGPYIAVSRRLHGGVELSLSYRSENHLAVGDTVERSLYPGNHGQALKHMVIQDVIECAKHHGPFESEASIVAFIKDRSDYLFTVVEHAKPASFTENEDGNTVEEGESE